MKENFLSLTLIVCAVWSFRALKLNNMNKNRATLHRPKQPIRLTYTRMNMKNVWQRKNSEQQPMQEHRIEKLNRFWSDNELPSVKNHEKKQQKTRIHIYYISAHAQSIHTSVAVYLHVWVYIFETMNMTFVGFADYLQNVSFSLRVCGLFVYWNSEQKHKLMIFFSHFDLNREKKKMIRLHK